MAPAKKAPATAAKKKSITFAPDTKAPATKKVTAAPPAKAPISKKLPDGVVAPRQNKKAPAKKVAVSKAKAAATAAKKKQQQEEEESSEDDDESESDEEDDLSDLADDSSSDDEAELLEDTKGRKANGKLHYPVLLLRYLPAEFQEPQLQKFLNQFGAKVVNCFCVRSKRTNVSKGTAYVQFDDSSVLPLVIEECNGMMLGGRTVRARKRMLHRPMPRRDEIRIRRLRGYRTATQGPKLTRHNTTSKNIVAALIKYSRSERANNEALKAMGIDFSSTAFQDQLKRLPKDLFRSKADSKKEEATSEAATPSSKAKKEEATTPSKATPTKAAVPATEEIVQPKVLTTPAKSPKAAPAPSPVKTPAPAKTPSKGKTPSKAKTPSK